MAIMDKIAIIDSKIKTMKINLGLPEDASLDTVVETTGAGGGGTSIKSNIYKVKTIAERDAIADMVEGDMCVVIDSTIANMTATDTPTEVTFPTVVVLPEAFTDFGYLSLRNSDNTVDVMVMMEPTNFRCDVMTASGYISIEYTSSDGITYTRTDANGNPINFGSPVSCMYPAEWKNAFGYFLQVGGVDFSGIYTYDNSAWKYSKIGLTVLDRNLQAGVKAYSDMGVVEGVLFAPLNNETYVIMENTLNTLTTDSTAATSLEGLYSTEIVDSSVTSLLTLPYVRTDNATSLKKMFYEQEKLTSLDLSNFNTTNVQDFSHMFYNNRALTTITSPNLNTSNGEHFDSMFYGCGELVNFDWTKLNTSKAKTMSNMFTYARKMEVNSHLQNINTDNATDISGLFKYNKGQLSWDITHFNTSNVENMSELFYGSEVASVNMAGLDTSKVTNMQGMFWGHRLTALDTTGIDTSNVTNMSHIFDNDWGGNTAGFSTIDAVANWDLSSLEDASHMFYCEGRSKYSKSLNRALTPNFKTNKISNMKYMFAVDVNDAVQYNFTFDVSNLDTSHATTMMQMFSGYGDNYTSTQGSWTKKIIGLSTFDTSNVTNMAGMFSGNYDVTSYDIDGWDTSKVETMASMFSSNRYITSLNLSSFTTESLTDMNNMFNGCERLATLDIRNMDFTNVANANNAFTNMNTSCLIIVKDDAAKAFVQAKNSALTNVKTVAEYEG